MKPVNNLNKTTPLQLLREGKTWLSIWESKRDENLFIALYCLLTALEFYLKAYLVFKDSAYKDTQKLKGLGHNFNTIFEKIIAVKSNKFTNEIKSQLSKYDLWAIEIDRLKYPEDRRMWMTERGLEKGDHTMGDIFKTIDDEITANIDTWLNKVYPKKIELGAMTQIDYEGDLEKADLKSLSDLCSNCLPLHIILFEHYNYPWDDELLPPRICVQCNNLFDPKEVRRNTTSEER